MGAPLASVSDANSYERFLVSGSYLIFYHVNGSVNDVPNISL